MHGFGGSEADGRKDGGSEVDTEGEVVVGAAVLLLRHARVADDEWHTDAFLVRIPLVSQAVLGVVVAVVGGEDDEGVVQDPLFFELIEYLAAGAVHLGGKPVVVLHHALVFLGRVKAPVPAIAAFVFLVKE